MKFFWFDWWPLMFKSNHEAMRRENLQFAWCAEPVKCGTAQASRLVLGSLAQGNERMTEMV